MQDISDKTLHRIYAEIVNGYSPVHIHSSVAFIRHPSLMTQAPLDEIFEEKTALAKKKGLLTEKQQLETLNKKGLWTTAQEEDIGVLRKRLSDLNAAKRNLYLDAQIKEQNIAITLCQKELETKFGRRNSLLTTTVEGFAEKKANDYFLFFSLFKDDKLSTLFFSQEEFDEITDEFSQIENAYSEVIRKFAEVNIQRVAIAPFFQNIYYYCDSDAFKFYGKPIALLTFHQEKLAFFGKYFRDIIGSTPDIPEDLLKNPEKLIEWYMGKTNLEKKIDEGHVPKGPVGMETKTVGTGVVGAKASDYKKMGMEGQVIRLDKIAKGKRLNKEQMIKIFEKGHL